MFILFPSFNTRQVPRPATTAGRASLNVLNWKSAYKVYSKAAGCRKQTVIFLPQHKEPIIYSFYNIVACLGLELILEGKLKYFA